MKKLMFKKWIILFLSTAVTLVACHSPVYNQTEGNVADVKIKTAAERKRADNLGKLTRPLVVKPGPYVDTTPISIKNRPSWLSNHIVIKGDRLPFSYFSRLIAAGGGSYVLTKYQVGLDPTQLISLNYSGTVSGALDLLATKVGYVYSITNNKIYWQAFVTRTYDIAFMPGDTDYMVGKKSEGGTNTAQTSQAGGQAQVSNYTTSDSSNSEYSNLSGKLSLWKDLQETISQMLSSDGKVSVSQASTSVTVRDRPSNVQLIGQYIHNLNNSLSRQVLVKVQVLEVNLSNSYNYGIDWNIVTNAFHNSAFEINAQYGTPINIQTLNGLGVPNFGTITNVETGKNPIPNYQVLLNALNEQGKASIVSEPRVLSLNNQVSVVRITNSQGYVASIQNTTLTGVEGGTSTTGTVTSQITPGMVITGLTIYILPKIINDRVYLSVNADLSVNNGFDSSPPTADGSSIQLPNVTSKHFNQRSMIKSGDTLILAGFKQLTNRTGAKQFLTSQALGGKAAVQLNTETVVLITPIVLHGAA
jgi:type IVB pilus formation R64 PilN family outer membrane protein